MSSSVTSVLILALSSAQAADLIVEPAPAPVAERFSYDWSGFYIGVHAGIGGGTFNHVFNHIADSLDEGGDYRQTEDITAFGAFGGVQVGYNHQFVPNWVAGIEADLSASRIKASDSRSYNWFDHNEFGKREIETKIDWFGTIRGRLGYAMDNFLIYGTGGAAYGSIKTSAIDSASWNDGTGGYYDSHSFSDIKLGWTAGAGFEYGLTEYITLKTEYLYVDLGSIETSGYNEFHSSDGDTSVDTAFHTLKTGLNYKF
ncbi:outer membrane protein [Mesorhizobium sp. ANAO-SY3R2]|uniref:outer membrane protein n=1 Tax=Mesorhizobium sp. ANAO-SY3R2 TaxID=3166644 RepID=UPI00366D5B7B